MPVDDVREILGNVAIDNDAEVDVNVGDLVSVVSVVGSNIRRPKRDDVILKKRKTFSIRGDKQEISLYSITYKNQM